MQELLPILKEWPSALVLLFFARGVLQLAKSHLETMATTLSRIDERTLQCPHAGQKTDADRK